MFNGPGLYDPECTAARKACKAEGVILIVYHGKRGEGFSVQGPIEMILALPATLRTVAAQIEEQIATLGEKV